MPPTWRRRVDAADWEAVTADMNDVGGALLPRLLSPTECAAVLDALSVLKVVDDQTRQRGMDLIERVVGMLTKLCR